MQTRTNFRLPWTISARSGSTSYIILHTMWLYHMTLGGITWHHVTSCDVTWLQAIHHMIGSHSPTVADILRQHFLIHPFHLCVLFSARVVQTKHVSCLHSSLSHDVTPRDTHDVHILLSTYLWPSGLFTGPSWGVQWACKVPAAQTATEDTAVQHSRRPHGQSS